MHPFPHHYRAEAGGTQTGIIQLSADSAPALDTAAPPEFDGPPGYWSPETLLVGSIADCYILTFRSVARASKLQWEQLAVDVEGVLDRADGVTRFVHFTIRPRVRIASCDAESLARTVMDKAKRSCLVTNSLSAACTLEPTVIVPDTAAAA